MQLHEALARAGQRARVAGPQKLLRGFGGQPAAEHRIIDAFAGGRGDDARRVARQQDVAAVVPAPQGLQRNRRAFPAHGRRAVEARQRAQVASPSAFSEKPLLALPVPTLIVSPCGNIQA